MECVVERIFWVVDVLLMKEMKAGAGTQDFGI
jgi:hypothetical protein